MPKIANNKTRSHRVWFSAKEHEWQKLTGFNRPTAIQRREYIKKVKEELLRMCDEHGLLSRKFN